MIISAIFPFWVTGAVTATGGAWNASIVAELATWGNTTLEADGLGAYIGSVTKSGETPLIIASRTAREHKFRSELLAHERKPRHCTNRLVVAQHCR